GRALLRSELAAGQLPLLSRAGHVAETQGSMGYQLELALRQALQRTGAEREVATLVSLVSVDPDDPGFVQPSKPIGPYYSRQRAQALEQRLGWRLAEDPDGRGWRRLVASPRPLELINERLLVRLVQEGVAVIAAGGGGISVVGTGEGWRPVDGVIDKDRTAMLIGAAVAADLWVSLTAVDSVYLEYGSEKQQRIERMSTTQARVYLEQGQFGSGSMGPKVESAIRFAEATGGTSLVTSVDRLPAAMEGTAGTLIEPVESLARISQRLAAARAQGPR
ncbi:MAG: carbamate kinase, partial [Acidobacteriota bacterium]